MTRLVTDSYMRIEAAPPRYLPLRMPARRKVLPLGRHGAGEDSTVRTALLRAARTGRLLKNLYRRAAKQRVRVSRETRLWCGIEWRPGSSGPYRGRQAREAGSVTPERCERSRGRRTCGGVAVESQQRFDAEEGAPFGDGTNLNDVPAPMRLRNGAFATCPSERFGVADLRDCPWMARSILRRLRSCRCIPSETNEAVRIG